jgi:hypothetical protein
MLEEQLKTLQKQGLIVLPQLWQREQLSRIDKAARFCFHKIEKFAFNSQLSEQEMRERLPDFYEFNPYCSSTKIKALNDDSEFEIDKFLESIDDSDLPDLISHNLSSRFRCNLSQSWLRKQYAIANYPCWHQPQSWHQDGCLGLQFPMQPPQDKITFDRNLNALITIWLPLSPCGENAPGLEFITQPIDKPVHFSYLNDSWLRSHFSSELFVRPIVTVGDAIVFLNQTLHRTYVNSEMKKDRLSVELRFFPVDD